MCKWTEKRTKIYPAITSASHVTNNKEQTNNRNTNAGRGIKSQLAKDQRAATFFMCSQNVPERGPPKLKAC